MHTAFYTRQFEKDMKRMLKRGKNLEKNKILISKLIAKEQMDDKFKDHPLIGNYQYRRECHIESDWLLIYKLLGNEIIFERTGSHSDLFD